MWCDPLVLLHTIGTPSTEQQSWMRMLRYVGHWQLMGYSYWAIEEKSSSKFIGEIGFADFKRNLTPSIDGIPEAGWALASHAHGRDMPKRRCRRYWTGPTWWPSFLKQFASLNLKIKFP